MVYMTGVMVTPVRRKSPYPLILWLWWYVYAVYNNNNNNDDDDDKCYKIIFSQLIYNILKINYTKNFSFIVINSKN